MSESENSIPPNGRNAIENRRARVRDLGISIGRFPTGTYNAITDVPGVLVGQKTVIRDGPVTVRSGVTVILPRDGKVHEDFPFAGFFSFNGIGEMTGLPLLEEWGTLTSPVVLTGTTAVGMAWDALSKYGTRKYGGFAYKLGVVAETYDGFLSDVNAYPLTEQDVVDAIESARTGLVAEGSTGGGTGMISYDFKGGTGTASRRIEVGGKTYTVGVLVQANHGDRHMLRVNGVPVGEEIGLSVTPGPTSPPKVRQAQPILKEETDQSADRAGGSSILIITATDAPLLPEQCKRLAKRATAGLARTGGIGLDGSGDLFLAFATGNHYHFRYRRQEDDQTIPLKMLYQGEMDPFFEATAEAVEESILNALTAADTMTGYRGNTVYALPLDRLMAAMKKYNRISD